MRGPKRWAATCPVIASSAYGAFLLSCGGTAAPTPHPAESAVAPAPSASALPIASAAVDEGPTEGAPTVFPAFRGRAVERVLSPNGKLLGMSTKFGVYLIDTETGMTRGFQPASCVTDFTFSGSGREVVMGLCREKKVRIWNLVDDTVRDAAVSTDCPLLSTTNGIATGPGSNRVVVVGWTSMNTSFDVVDTKSGATRSWKSGPIENANGAFMSARGAPVLTSQTGVFIGATDGSDAIVHLDGTVDTASMDHAGTRLVYEGTGDPDGAKGHVVDLDTGKVLAKGTPCNRPGFVQFTADDAHIVHLCLDDARTSSATLETEHQGSLRSRWMAVTRDSIVAAHGQDAAIYPLGDLENPLALFGKDAGVFDAASAVTGDTIIAVDASGVGLFSMAKLDALRPAKPDSPPRLTPLRHIAESHREPIRGAAGSLLPSSTRDFDTSTRQWTPESEVTADGSVTIERTPDASGAGGTVTFRERKPKGATWSIKLAELNQFWEISAHGRYILTESIDNSTRLGKPILVVHSATAERSIPHVTGMAHAMSPTEDVMASAEYCEDQTNPACGVIRLTTLATGSASLLRLDHPPGANDMQFSPDGRRLAAEGAVYDVMTHQTLWKLEDRTNALTFLNGGKLAAIAHTPSHGPRDVAFVDAATGKELHRIPSADLIGESDNGAFVVIADGAKVDLLDTQTFKTTPLPLDSTWALPSPDGSIVWGSMGSTVSAYRTSDGRTLTYLDDGVMTDQGVCSSGANASYATRFGPSVLRGRVESAPVPEGRVRPTLEADFFAGRAVAP